MRTIKKFSVKGHLDSLIYLNGKKIIGYRIFREDDGRVTECNAEKCGSFPMYYWSKNAQEFIVFQDRITNTFPVPYSIEIKNNILLSVLTHQ